MGMGRLRFSEALRITDDSEGSGRNGVPITPHRHILLKAQKVRATGRPNAAADCPPVQRSLTRPVGHVDDVLHVIKGAQHHLDHLQGALGAGQMQRGGLVVLP